MPARISLRDAANWLFTMNLTGVYHSVFSDRDLGNYFVGKDIENGYVRATGVIERDTEETATVGLGYFDDVTAPLAWSYEDVRCNEVFTVRWAQHLLSSNVHYLGYIQCPSGTAQDPYTGYIDFFDNSWV